MPYAYGAKIEHEFDTDHLNIWLTFRHPMDQTVKPPLALWLLEEDGNTVDIIASDWQDEFTILLTSDTIVDAPQRVTIEYDGPDSGLQTTWGKDWEPWGAKLSADLTATLLKSGMIILWSGSVESIPTGFALCDGNNDTPDLRDKFVIGAGNSHAPDNTGGESSHAHDITDQDTGGPSSLGDGGTFVNQTGSPVHTHNLTGETDSKNTLPPYYALCYIMKL